MANQQLLQSNPQRIIYSLPGAIVIFDQAWSIYKQIEEKSQKYLPSKY